MQGGSRTLQNSKTLGGSTQALQAGVKKTDEQKKAASEEAEKRELSAEERVMNEKISAVEQNSLDRVFALLCGHNSQTASAQKPPPQETTGALSKMDKNYFTAKDIARVLADLEYPAQRTEIDQMIWEIDEKLTGQIDKYEFELMYKRCSMDKTGLEPKSLYNVVQFLMFLQSQNQNDDNPNRQNKKKITTEDTLELLYVRYGRNKLDQEIEEIFGKDIMNSDGQEKEISLTEYLQKIKKKDFKWRKAMERKRKDVSPNKDQKHDDDYYL